jgi:hypothetical protein
VLVLSLGGAGDALVDGYLEAGVMPNLAALAQRGARAEHMLAVDPASSLTAHVSLASGAYPSKTNQVADRFHLPESPLHAVVESVARMQTTVEPLWRAAMRHGLTTATLFWPGAESETEASLADLIVTRGAPELGSALHVLTTTVAAEWEGAPESYSPALEATLAIMSNDGPLAMQLAVLAVDGTDDQQENYDTIYLAQTRDIGPESMQLRVGGWAAFEPAPRLYGRGQIKLISVSADRIELYRTAMWYTRAQPAELLRGINRQFGFCPPPPDDQALERGWISPEEYWQMSQRQNRWCSDVVAYVFDEFRPDLTLAWLGVTEQIGRHFLLAEQAQLEEDSGAALGAELVAKAYGLADESLGKLLDRVVLGRDTIFVVSGHGLAPAHTEVRVNSLLSDADLLGLTGREDVTVDVEESQAFAVASGGAAHIYVNLAGREEGGVVAWDEHAAVCSELVDLLGSTTGPDGDPVFARVVQREDLHTLGLDSFATGDVFVQAWPGYVLSDAVDGSEVFGEPRFSAAAGYDASQRSMHAILVAAGFGIQSGAKLPVVRLIDIAPTLAKLLNAHQVDHVDGHVLNAMLRAGQ